MPVRDPAKPIPSTSLACNPGSHSSACDACAWVAFGSDAMEQRGLGLEIRPDRHFLSSLDGFEEHIEGRRQLLLERFYREMRRDRGILMDGDEPAGDRWNYSYQALLRQR